MDNDYLIKKPPLQALFLFALPMIIGNLFQQTYTMVDSAIVGRYVSEQALAAVGASYALTNIFICVAIGGGIGASVIVSRYFGAKEYGRMKTAVFTALLSFLGISLVLGIAGLILGKQIMVWLNTPADCLDMASEYLRIYFLGLPFLFMYNVLSAMFNALGKSRIPLYFLIFSSIFNVILDIIMVTKMDMGVAGVAWATLIAQGISAVLSFGVLLKNLKGLEGKQKTLFDKMELAEITQFANQPTGTAYQTMAMPNLGAQVTAIITRIPRFTRFATVNIFISPAPLSRPSTAILNPMKQKNQPINVR